MVIPIIYVIGELDVGGAERHLLQVLPQLSLRGFSPVVYTISRKGKLAPMLEMGGIPVIAPFLSSRLGKLPAVAKKPLLLMSSFFSFLLLLHKVRPAIVHFFLPQAYVLGGVASLLWGRPLRVMSRRSMNHYQAKMPFLARMEKRLHSKMDAILGNSRRVVDDLKSEGVEEGRLGLLYNGIDLAALEEGRRSRAAVRDELCLDERDVLIVCVANLIPYKGHADLIRALGLTRREGAQNQWRVAMVGRDNGIGPDLRQLAHDEGVADTIFWMGERSDVAAIYAAADVGMLVSHEEGFSNSVLEGMASGIPMIVTDVGGNAEAVTDGECGYVVPPFQPEAIKAALLNTIRNADIRERMGIAGRRRVLERFSLDACVKGYAQLYHQLLENPACNVQRALDMVSSDDKEKN